MFFICGVALRIVAVRGDLWLDEIWSLQTAAALTAPWQILTSVHSDNSHVLNTAWMFTLGPAAAAWAYRLPALIFALLSLIYFARLARSVAPRAELCALALFSFSYLPILYGTEARGYSAALFFALCAVDCAVNSVSRVSLKRVLVFSLSCILGLLAHLSFINVLIGVGLWYAALMLRRQTTLRDALKVFLLPVVFVAALYWNYVRELEPVQGPLRGYLEVILETLAMLLGSAPFSPSNPRANVLVLFFSISALCLLLFGLRSLKADARRIDLLLFLVIFVSPPLTLFIFEPRTIFPRYFFLGFSFTLIPLASLISERLAKHGGSRRFACVVVGVFLVFNLLCFYRLAANGRNPFAKAASFMEMANGQRPIQIAASHPFRMDKLLFELQRAHPELGSEFRRVSLSEQFDFYVLQSQDVALDPALRLELEPGGELLLSSYFLSAPLSGTDLYIYTPVDAALR